jgi:CheY-like chemotaxis protein/DNA-binding Xre family transcriptional regulator
MGAPDITTRFGASVRNLRFHLGLSQEELAERASLHRTYIAGIEGGTRNVTLRSIEKLARALKVPTATLLSQAGKPVADKPAGERFSADELVDILFVEDQAEDVELTVQALTSANVANRIHLVRDGAAALHFLFGTGPFAHREGSHRPQMILLDLNLPKISGLEVLRRIKADPRTRSIPVVVLTASKRDRDIETSRRLGAEAYIVKPVDFQNLSEVTPQLSLQWALLKARPTLGA